MEEVAADLLVASMVHQVVTEPVAITMEQVSVEVGAVQVNN